MLHGGRLVHFLQKWQQLTSDPWVLQCVRGYKLEFATTPPIQRRLPSCRARGPQQVEVLNEEVGVLLSKGAIREVPYHSTQFVSTLFTVPKKTGGLRPVINLKPLNRYLQVRRFKMEGLGVLKHLLQPGDFMGKVDLKDAYFTIPVDVNSRRFLTFQWQGRFYQFQCVPFGVATAPRVFTKVLKVPIALLRRQGYRLIVYLDDVLVFGRTREGCREALMAVLQLLSSLGFVPNREKSILEPTQRITFLGSGIDSLRMIAFLPDGKVQELQQLAVATLSTDSLITARELASLIGKMQATTGAVWHAPLHFRSLQRLLITVLRVTRGNWEFLVPLTEAARADLRWWRDQLSNHNSRPILLPTADMVVETDASKIGWGGFCNGVHTGGRWSAEERTAHINVLELQAASLAVRGFCRELQSGHIRVRSDNSTVVAYLNHLGGTRSLELLSVTLDLWEWCTDRNLSISAEHIPGRDNVRADFSSRHFSVATEWTLDRHTFLSLQATFPLLSKGVDLFASRTNHQLPQFVSWHPEPEAIGTDAFTLRWNEWGMAYAFPPFILIARTLRKVQQDRAQVLLIAPVWDTAIWYPVLLEMLVGEPVLLPRHEHLLTQPESHRPHPEGKKLLLAAWPVCGDNTASPLREVLEFLLSLYEKGLQYRTLNVYRSAISTTHLPVEGQPLGQHPLVKRFLKGVFELRPALPKYSFTWDTRLEELQSQLTRSEGAHNSTREELRKANDFVQELKQQCSTLEGKLASTEMRLTQSQRQADPEGTSPMDTSSSLTDETKVLKNQLQLKEKEIAGLKEQVSLGKQHVEQYKNMATAMEKNLSEQNQASRQLQERLETRLKEATQTRETLEKQIQQLEKEKQAAGKELSEIRDSQGKHTADLRKSLSSLQTEVRDALQKAEDADRKEQEARNDLEQQVKLASEAQDKYERELMLHAADVQALSAVKEQLEDHNDKLSAAQEEARKAQEELRLGKVSREEQKRIQEQSMTTLQSRCQELEKQNNLLHEQIEKLSNQMLSLQARPSRETSVTAASVSEEGKSSEQLLEIIHFIRREKDIAETRFEVTQAESVRYQQRLEQLERQLTEAQQALGDERSRTEAAAQTALQHQELLKKVETLNVLTDSNKLLREEKERVEGQLQEVTAKVQQLQKDIEPLQENNRKLSTMNGSLQAAFTNVTIVHLSSPPGPAAVEGHRAAAGEQPSSSCRRTSSRCRRTTVQQLQKDIEPLQENNRKLSTMNGSLQAENTMLKKDVDRWTARTRQLIEQSNKADPEEIKRLTEERDNLQKQMSSNTEQMHKFRAEASRLNTQLSAEKNKTSEASRESMRLKTDVNQLKAQNSSLQGEMAGYKSFNTKQAQEIESLKKEVQAKSAEVEEKLKSVTVLKKIGRRYKSQFEEKNTECEALSKEMETVKKENEELKTKVAQAPAQGAAAEAATPQQQAQLEEKTKAVEEMQQQLKTFEDQVTKLRQEAAEVEEKLKKAEEEKTALQASETNLTKSLTDEKEKAKKVLFAAKQKIQQLTNQRDTRDKEVSELKDKSAAAEQSKEELELRLSSLKSQYEGKIMRLERQLSDVQEQNRHELDRQQQEQQDLQKRVEEQQRQLEARQKQLQVQQQHQVQQMMPSNEPPTANIRPMATPSTSTPTSKVHTVPPVMSGASSSHGSTHGSTHGSNKPTPRASIRPIAKAPATVSVTPTSSGSMTPTATVMPTTQADTQEVVTVAPVSGVVTVTNTMAVVQATSTQQATAFVQPTQQHSVVQAEVQDIQPSATVSPTPVDRTPTPVEQTATPPHPYEPQPGPSSAPEPSQDDAAPSGKRQREMSTPDVQGGDAHPVTKRAKTEAPTEEPTEVTEADQGLGEEESAEEPPAGTAGTAAMSQPAEDSDDDVIVVDDDDDEEEVDDEDEEEEYEEGDSVDEEDYEDDVEEEGSEGEEEMEEEQEEEEEETYEMGEEGESGEEMQEEDAEEEEEEEEELGDEEQGSDEDVVEIVDDDDEPAMQGRDQLRSEAAQPMSTDQDNQQSRQQPQEEQSRPVIQSRPRQPVPTLTVQPPPTDQSQPQPIQPQRIPPRLEPRLLPTGRAQLAPFSLGPGHGGPAFEDVDDCTVPSTPTLFVPRRTDGFAEALNSPQIQGVRFSFGPPSEIAEMQRAQPGLAQLATQGALGMDDTHMDLLGGEDEGSGRSVPTTPVHLTAPVTVFSEGGPSVLEHVEMSTVQSIPRVPSPRTSPRAVPVSEPPSEQASQDVPQSSGDSQTGLEDPSLEEEEVEGREGDEEIEEPEDEGKEATTSGGDASTEEQAGEFEAGGQVQASSSGAGPTSAGATGSTESRPKPNIKPVVWSESSTSTSQPPAQHHPPQRGRPNRRIRVRGAAGSRRGFRGSRGGGPPRQQPF
ncbi:TPR [Branchiostoma lanceolatum]|uniref:ribonuclease H n=1 Tax=Branchiostoma lanceolatum TaxID=7740 RepID=A0A8J9ZLQ7_BRALA|nr:TPR [Branchiostoma lanceolatum]